MKSKKSMGRTAAGILAAIGLAGLTAMNPLPQNVNNSQDSQNAVNQNVNNKKESAPVQQQNTRQTPTPQFIGGLPMAGWRGDYGNSPQWYGENKVRKGTHKRTNV